jgi:hypothetical protein
VVLLADQIARVAGVGESGLPPAAPAIANAVRALTGARLRELPMLPERVKPALKTRACSSFAPLGGRRGHDSGLRQLGALAAQQARVERADDQHADEQRRRTAGDDGKMCRTGRLVSSSRPAINGPAIEPILATEIAHPAPLLR